MNTFLYNLKQKLSPSTLSIIRKTLAQAKATTIRVVSTADLLSSAYYFFSGNFRREERAVAAGIDHYFSQHKASANIFLLRRNIHRLEKGLLMRPRKAFFGVDYINETVECYRECLKSSCQTDCDESLSWAQDILTLYFDSVEHHPMIAKAKSVFDTLRQEPSKQEKIPYHREQTNPVSYKDFFALCRQRRSVRWYNEQQIPRELIDQAILAAAQSPSACNRQPFSFRIFDNPQLAQELASIPFGTRGFAGNIPALCVLVGDLSAYFSEKDRHIIYIDAALAAMSFMYALETLGLSSCPLNFPDITSLDKKITKKLGLKKHERVIMLISFGYPDTEGLVAYSQKKTLPELRTYNQTKA